MTSRPHLFPALACSLLLLLCGARVHADAETTLNLYLNGGYYWFNSDRLDGTPLEGFELEDSWGGGGGFDYMVSDRWGFGGAVDLFSADVNGIDESVDVYSYHLDIFYQFAGRFCGNFCWQPYIVFGAGEIRVDSDNDSDDDFDDGIDGDRDWHERQTMVNLGLGVKYRLGPRWQARADARSFYGVEESGVDGFVSLSIGYQWGGDVVLVRDHDRDGIVTGVDQCPTTPFGLEVDELGCPLDLDRDGVPDYLDNCPGTPIGTPVTEYGCPM